MSEEVQNPKAGQGLGIAALILGIVGVICSFIVCLWWMGVVLGIVGLILGFISRSQAAKAGAKKGLGTTGIILGILAVVIAILWFVLIVSAANEAAGGLMELSEQMQELENAQ